MRILIGHNYYQQAGGEDAVFRSHAQMLKGFGHDVCLYERRNDEIKPDVLSRARHAFSLRWSQRSYDEVRQLLRTFKPQVAHFHNIFFVTTPSVFYACRDEGVPVVVSFHNFRLMCVNGLFFRDNHPCEDCLQKSWVEGIKHKCYRGSRLFSALAGDMVQHHWKKHTWTQCIDRVITATEFSRQKYIQAGIPSEKAVVLPHFVEPPLTQQVKGHYALYAGRLSEEKGVDLVLRAWEGIKNIPLYIVGTGPQQAFMEQYIKERGMDNVKIMGFLDSKEYAQILSQARVLIVPSLCYENFPRVVVEAYSYGVPVVASRLGTLEEIIKEGQTGHLFNSGDAIDLASQIRRIFDDEQEHARLSQNTLKIYEQFYTPQKHYDSLLRIYSDLKKE